MLLPCGSATVCVHASKEKIFSHKCENFYVIIISKFTKVQLEVITVLWGKINVP